jgi:Fe-S-cluster-containing dehydrogenase component
MELHLKFDPLSCIGCDRCEVACGNYRDMGYTVTSASVMLYRGEEKKDYFGLLYKSDIEMVGVRPEGVFARKPGDEASGPVMAGGKPILLRPNCDRCDPAPCEQACPTGAISR